MTFIPELYALVCGICIFIFSISFQYSFIMRFPLNSLYLVYFYSIIFINFIYLLSSDLNINFYFIDFAFNKTNFTYVIEFVFAVIFIVYVNSVFMYNTSNSINNFEFMFITFNCTFICIFIINSTNFFIIFILIELLSLCLYVLAAFNRRKLYSIEAGIKYFILGSFSSSLILLGIIFLYGLTGFLSFEDLYILFLYNNFFLSNYYLYGVLIALTLILIGFLFKLYSAPFHFWILDIYQGSPISSLLFFSSIYIFTIMYLFSKLFFLVVLNFNIIFYYFYIAFSISCMLFGSIGALLQKKIKKLIAFSTIAFIGYYISSFIAFNLITIQSAVFYLFVYIINLLGIFIFILNTKSNGNNVITKINDVSYMLKSNKLIAMIFSFLLFTISGLPPFFGFFGKSEFYSYLLSEYNILYLAISSFFTLISFFYYIRIVKNIYFNSSSNWVNYSTPNYIISLFYITLFILNFYVFFSENFFLAIIYFFSFSIIF